MQWRIYAPAALVVLAGFAAAYAFVEPAPPRSLTMATGQDGGAYALFGERYAAALRERGVTLELRATAGSVENLELLREPASGVVAALVQGGITDAIVAPGEDAGLVSLGAVFLEPFALFTTLDPPPRRLTELAGRRIAVGVAGSGTRLLTLRLLALAGIDAEQAHLLPLGGEAAAEALERGEVDVVAVVAAPTAPLVRRLARQPGVTLVGLVEAAALARHHPEATTVVIPRGLMDVAEMRPPGDVTLVAVTANLVVREELHPALKELLLQAARDTHAAGDMVSPPRRFPSPFETSFPLAAEAARFYERGPPFLQRYLPFWLAVFVDRTAILIIPAITLLVPLLRLLPPAVRWRFERRVYRWYGRLGEIETLAGQGDPTSRATARARLAQLEVDIGAIRVPLGYQHLVYHLRQHVDLVRRRVEDRAATPPPST